MKARFPRLRLFDYIAAVVVIGLIVAASITVYSSGSDASLVRVQTEKGEFVYDLAADVSLDFEGPIGITHVEIMDGKAKITSSPCREQICVNTGALDSAGDWAACLPNRIVIEITGTDEAEVDVLSY